MAKGTEKAPPQGLSDKKEKDEAKSRR